MCFCACDLYIFNVFYLIVLKSTRLFSPHTEYWPRIDNIKYGKNCLLYFFHIVENFHELKCVQDTDVILIMLCENCDRICCKAHRSEISSTGTQEDS